MEGFAIVTDSFCELNEELRKKFDIDFVPDILRFRTEARKNSTLPGISYRGKIFTIR